MVHCYSRTLKVGLKSGTELFLRVLKNGTVLFQKVFTSCKLHEVIEDGITSIQKAIKSTSLFQKVLKEVAVIP